MGQGIAPRDAGGAVERPAPGGPPRHVEQGAASTREVAFAGKVRAWTDMPYESRAAAYRSSEVVAEHVDTLNATALRISGAPHQRMVGWTAYADRIVLATAVRELRTRADGRLSPAGAWRHHALEEWVASAPPRRREGVVAVGRPAPFAPPGASPAPRTPRDHLNAAQATGYLPAPVRQGLLDAVPEPRWWLGEIVRYTENSYPVRHRFVVLRANDARAAVVVAERRLPPQLTYPEPAAADAMLAETSWSVTQVTYELTRSARLEGSERPAVGR